MVSSRESGYLQTAQTAWRTLGAPATATKRFHLCNKAYSLPTPIWQQNYLGKFLTMPATSPQANYIVLVILRTIKDKSFPGPLLETKQFTASTTNHSTRVL